MLAGTVCWLVEIAQDLLLTEFLPAQVKAISQCPGVFKAVFDQCQFGLVSVEAKLPLRKRTCVLTNSSVLHKVLHNKLCTGNHEHQAIQGSEGGRKRSEAAAEYPEPLVRCLCESFLQEGKHLR